MSSLDLIQFRKQCLDAHNKYRAIHGAVPVKENRKISDYAQNWAEKMARTGKLEHSSESDYGENIAYTMTTNESDIENLGHVVTKMWYSEIKDYDFENHRSKNGNATGHFTQVVWKGSTEVGFGVAKDGHEYFAVANYNPAGNIITGRYFADNVGPVDGKAEETTDEEPKEPPKDTEVTEELTTLDIDEGNILERPTMKKFRWDFIDKVNVLREERSVPKMERSKPLQKLAQKNANTSAKNKIKQETDPQVRSQLRLSMQSSSPPGGADVANSFAQGSGDMKKLLDSLMSEKYESIGVGFSFNGKISHVIIYMA